MIIGVGHDICEIERIQKSAERPSFVSRVYGPHERDWFETLGPVRKYRSMASNFAAKEAFLKACGKGLGGFPLAEIEILRKETGEPYFIFGDGTARWLAEKKLTSLLSLTHEKGIASAVVILQPDESNDAKI